MREPSQTEKNDFYAAMDPLWDDVADLLAADRPSDWQGYHFEAEVHPEAGAVPLPFTIKVTFRDRVSNRVRGGVPRHIVDKLAALRVSYLEFSPMMTWRTVRIEQIWDARTRSYSRETNWTY